MPPSAPYPAAVEFGARVKARRLELEISQEGLAELIGTVPNYVSQIEGGYRNVGLRTILRVARALEMDPGDLIRDLGPID